MGKITGMEEAAALPEKVLKLYKAVVELIGEGADVTNLRVSTITERAGIGKGTAYEYFESREEIIACAVVHYIRKIFSWLKEELLKRDNFEDQLDFLLEKIDESESRKFCVLRFVHMLTDNSEFCLLVQQKTQMEEFKEYIPGWVIADVLKQGVARGDLRSDLPMDYMVYSIFSHLMTYMMVLTTAPDYGVNAERTRVLARLGILNELCEKKA